MGLRYSLFIAWNLALFVTMIEMNGGSDEELIVKREGQASIMPPTLKVNHSKPVVCYEHDRDELRHRLITWLRNQHESMEEMEAYRKLLRAYFNLVDKTNDGKLDGTEFTEFIKTNDSIGEVSSSDSYANPILQSLCADALISVSDDDADWELSFEEFAKCLDPEFEPPKKGCELYDRVYKDGTEIPTNCNSCVCACGNWVCTVLQCGGENNTNQASDEKNDEANKSKFIVEGEEAKEQLTREMMDSEEQEKKKILPLLKP